MTSSALTYRASDGVNRSNVATVTIDVVRGRHGERDDDEDDRRD